MGTKCRRYGVILKFDFRERPFEIIAKCSGIRGGAQGLNERTPRGGAEGLNERTPHGGAEGLYNALLSAAQRAGMNALITAAQRA